MEYERVHAAALLSDKSSSVDSLILHGDVVKVSSKSSLGLFSSGNLGGENINKFFILHNLGLKLVASTLKLLNASHTLSLIARLPELSLSLGLGKGLESIRLAHSLILQLLSQVLEVSGQHLVLGEEGSTVLGLSIGKSLCVLQLGGDGDLGLVHVGNGVLELLNLSVEVLVLNLETLLGGLSLIESSGHLIQSGVGVNNGSLEQLALLVKLSLALDGILQIKTSITEVKLKSRLVLLRLDLVGIEAVNLLTKVGHGVIMLHAESSKSSLLGNVEFLELGLESGELTLTLLVELNLGGGVGSSLLKTRGNVLNVLLQHGAGFRSLGTVASLNIELLIELLNAGHQLLGLLGVLGSKGGLVINLGGQGASLLLLAGDGSKKLSLHTLEVRNGLLGQLEVTLQLPLGLLNISLHLLLTLKSILSLIEGLLELALYSGQMVALVLSGLDVLLGLLAAVANRSLLLGKLANHVRLVSDLVLEGPDLVILVGSVLLSGGKDSLKVANLTLELGNSGVDLLDLSLKSNLLSLLTLDAGIDTIKLLLDISSLSLNSGGLVNDLLDSRSSRLQGKGELILLAHEAIIDSLDLGPGLKSLANVSLGQGNLVLVLLLELAKLGALEVGLDGQPDLGPEPGLGSHVHADSTLAGVQSQLLVLELLELHPGGLASGSGLEPGENGSNLVLTELLHLSGNSSPEEDFGVTKTVLLLVHSDDVHDSQGGGLLVLGLGHKAGGNDVVASLELGIEGLIRESHPADSDTSEHTVTLVLMHHKVGLNTSGNLVSVGHNTTDEVGLGLVEGGHQVIKLALEVGRHSLAASLLLPVLVLGSLKRLSRVVSEALNHQRVASILDHLDNGVIERILVLLEPSSQVVGHGGGVVNDGEMRIRVGPGVGLGKVGPLTQQVGVELLAEGLVSGLGEERLLLKDGQESHGLLKHGDARTEIHTEVAVGPVKTLLDVFLLLEGEHVLVEELLQLLVDVVDTDLLKAVVVENLETGNIEHTNVGDLLHGGVDEGLVTLLNHNPEGSLVDGTSNTGNRVGSTLASGTLGDPLSSDLQLGLAEVGDHPLAVNAKESSNLLGIGIILDLSLLFLANGDKVLSHVAHMHHAGGVPVHIILLLLGEAKRHEGLMSELHVLLVVNGGDSELALGDIPVVKDLIAEEALLLEVGNFIGHDVVEGVVASLKGLLVSQTRLLKQVDNHVSSGQLTRLVEMDTDELSESGGVVIPHSLGVTPGLEHRVGGNDLILKGGLSLLPLARGADGGEV